MKKMVIFYPYFSPAFRAGGPVQSLLNMAQLLSSEYRVYVVCGAYDLGVEEVLPNIQVNQWNDFSGNIRVFYARNSEHHAVRTALKELNPELIYINGLFSLTYNLLPLFLANTHLSSVIVAPRGMLQQGALAIRSTKKKIYLTLFKLFRLHKKVRWHVTDQQEGVDVIRIFGDSASIRVVPNIPRIPVARNPNRMKKVGELKLVYFSLITEKKNLHLLLEALREVHTAVSLDIWGPVKDKEYWESCKQLIKNQIHTIRYRGVVEPVNVQTVLSGYHAFVLPTRGENFGHAIYESLSAGTPAIISLFTPWGVLQDKEAGITHELNVQSLAAAIRRFVELDNNQFTKLSLGASKVAIEYFQQHDYLARYRELFHS